VAVSRMNRVLAAAVFVVLFSEGLLLAQGYGGVGFPGGGGKGIGALATFFLPLTGGTMTGAIVCDDGLGGPSTCISTGTSNDLHLAPAGTRQVKVTSGDTSTSNADWIDDAFCVTDNPASGGIRLRPGATGNLEFTNSIFTTYIAGIITANGLTITGAGNHAITSTAGALTVTAASGIGMASDTNFSGRIRLSTLSPTAFTGTQDNYTGCTGAVRCRLSGSSTPILDGMSGMALAEQRTLCNVGGTDIVIAHEAAGSTAANRFDLVGSTNYTLVQKGCKTFIYDATDSRWRAEQ